MDELPPGFFTRSRGPGNKTPLAYIVIPRTQRYSLRLKRLCRTFMGMAESYRRFGDGSGLSVHFMTPKHWARFRVCSAAHQRIRLTGATK